MFDKQRFMAAIVIKGKNVEDVAKLLGMSASTLYRKMNGDSDFFRNEIQQLCVMLEIKDPSSIFFAQDIALTQSDTPQAL